MQLFWIDPVVFESTINRSVMEMPYIKGGGLPAGKFLFKQMHFHWGADSKQGSEHIIKTERSEMNLIFLELQFLSLSTILLVLLCKKGSR